MWGSGKGLAQLWISAPPALLTIVLLMVASAVAFVVSSGILAAGNPGVAAAALVAASAALISVSLSAFADRIASGSPNRVVLTRCLSDNVHLSPCRKAWKDSLTFL